MHASTASGVTLTWSSPVLQASPETGVYLYAATPAVQLCGYTELFPVQWSVPMLDFLLSAYNIPSQAHAALCTSLLLVLMLIPYEGLAEAPSHTFETL